VSESGDDNSIFAARSVALSKFIIIIIYLYLYLVFKFLFLVVEAMFDEDEVLLALAEQLGSNFVSCVGGPDYVQTLLVRLTYILR